MDTDIVSWNDFPDQHIVAVSLESIIFSIKRIVMRVTPATASTCFSENKLNQGKLEYKDSVTYQFPAAWFKLTQTLVLSAAAIVIINLLRLKSVDTCRYDRIRWITLYRPCGNIPIYAGFSGTSLFPCLSILLKFQIILQFNCHLEYFLGENINCT